MRLMADTTDDTAPAGYDLYAGYTDGSYRSFGPLSRLYPGRVVPITVTGNDLAAAVADVEAGDLSPATAPRWVKRKGASRYCLWAANYTARANPVHGAVAWQYVDHGPHGENIDLSHIYDDGWPYADVPTLYCPSSWAPDVMQACAAAGLVYAAAGTIHQPQQPTEEIDVLQLVILSVPAGGYQVLWNLPGNKLIPLPNPADASVEAGVPVWVVDQAFVDAVKNA